MREAIAILLMGLNLAPAAAPSPAGELSARFLGNMGFRISDGTVEMLTDFPYQSGYSDYMKWDPAQAGAGPATRPTALCLVTHRHRDHFAAELAGNYCGKLVGPRDVVSAVPERALAMDAAVTHGPVRIEPISTTHAGLEHYSYVVTWNGLRLFFTGDTEDVEPLLRAKSLDYAFVSPWLLAQAAKRGATIDARHVVVYHHADGETIPRFHDRLVPRQGETLRLMARSR